MEFARWPICHRRRFELPFAWRQLRALRGMLRNQCVAVRRVIEIPSSFGNVWKPAIVMDGTFLSYPREILKCTYGRCLLYMMSTEEKKTPRRPITERKKNLAVFDHQIHQTLATDVIGVSFDAQWYEVFGYQHGKSVGCVIPELRGLGWSST